MTADEPTPETSLAELGWKPFFAAQVPAEELETCRPVRVMAAHRGSIAVAGEGLERLIAPHIAKSAPGETRAAVGDWLMVQRDTLQIARILARTSLFQRRAPGNPNKRQLIAANVDTLFIVASCNEDFNLARLERYLVLARESGVTPVIVLTKADLAAEPETFAEAARGLQPGLVVELVNGKDPHSVARLAAWCGTGETVALVGSSGVGKSTMVNSLRGAGEGSGSIATQAVREADGKGRHTTTVRELHRLANGGWLMDTPGMRELQLPDVAAGLAEVFDDIEALALTCRFTNCSHGSEPACAVRDALASGVLDAERVGRWRKLNAEAEAALPGWQNRSRKGR